MATVLQHTFPQPQVSEIQKRNPTVPIKVGIFGDQGTGKTTSAALLAVALSKEVYAGAPVWVTDPELGWQFPERRIFKPEGVELVRRNVPTFKAMMDDMREAERAGACVYAVELSKIWTELLKTVRARCGDNWGSELVNLWTEYVNRFLNSNMCCIGLGRVTDVTEDMLDEQGNVRHIKVNDTLKAGGARNNFGYEPHLVIRMKLEQRPRTKNGVKLPLEEDSRMIHVADVRKDRTWALNNRLFRWPDKNEYKLGDYKRVWASIRPHWVEVQATMGFAVLDISASSDAMIADNGNSEWRERREQREVFTAEIKACLDLFIGGRKQEDVEARIAMTELIFGVKSKEAADRLSLTKLERGLRILHSFEKNVAPPVGMPDTKEGVLVKITESIREYDEGKSEEWDMPF